MNAPTTVAQWERYRPSLDALKPGCSEDEARFRCGIMLLRDWAHRHMQKDALGLLQPIWINASAIALCPMTVEQLRDCWGALGRMCMAARRMREISDAVSGGSDARD